MYTHEYTNRSPFVHDHKSLGSSLNNEDRFLEKWNLSVSPLSLLGLVGGVRNISSGSLIGVRGGGMSKMLTPIIAGLVGVVGGL